MTVPSLPIDIWLIIFNHIDAAYQVLDDTDADSLTILWCIARNVSPHLRDCTDEYFRHSVLQNMLISLNYSNMNHHGGPFFVHLQVPMKFFHLVSDGTRAVFRQYAYRDNGARRICTGSLRGWVPSVQHYYDELPKPKPEVVHREKVTALTGPPAWERA